MGVQAKFRVTKTVKYEGYFGQGPQMADQVQLVGVKGEPFGPQTPQASLEMTVLNPEAAAQFEVGKEYLVTFQEAPKED